MAPSRRRHSLCGEGGATAVVVAVVVSVLCSFLVLALNVGHGYSVRAELQNAGDSAALAAVADVGGADIPTLRSSLGTARTTASTYAGFHTTDSTVSVGSPDVCLGIWHTEYATPSFECVSTSAASDAAIPDAQVYLINAVQVGAARNSNQTGGALTVYGGGIVGQTQTNVVTRATAARLAPCTVGCAAPLAFASCQVDAGMLPCGLNTTMMSNATEDNIGFTIYSSNQQANGPSIQHLLMTGNGKNAQCKPDFCGSQSLPTAPTDIKLQNGNDLTNTNSATSVYNSLMCLAGKAVLVGIVDANCMGTNPQFSGTHPLVTWAKVTIVSVDSVAKTITLRRECGDTTPNPGQCPPAGLLSDQPILVQ
jgi:hypothetical protein